MWVDLTVSLVRDASGAPDYEVAVIQDIGDRKRSEEELRKAIALRDRFLTIASHELKTPLTTLMLQAQTFARSAAAADEASPRGRFAASAAAVLRQTRRLSALVDQLLDVSRVNAGRLQLELEDVDLAALARDVVGCLAEEAGRARAPITLEAAGEPVVGRWDRPEDQARIFERYERAVGEREFCGFGVGLWIAREIVNAHRGTIRVESAPEHGATFILDLPRRRDAAP